LFFFVLIQKRTKKNQDKKMLLHTGHPTPAFLSGSRTALSFGMNTKSWDLPCFCLELLLLRAPFSEGESLPRRLALRREGDAGLMRWRHIAIDENLLARENTNWRGLQSPHLPRAQELQLQALEVLLVIMLQVFMHAA
jgi:hypothetical protein